MFIFYPFISKKLFGGDCGNQTHLFSSVQARRPLHAVPIPIWCAPVESDHVYRVISTALKDRRGQGAYQLVGPERVELSVHAYKTRSQYRREQGPYLHRRRTIVN